MSRIAWAAGVGGWVAVVALLGWQRGPDVWGASVLGGTPARSVAAAAAALDGAHYRKARHILTALAKAGNREAEIRLAEMDQRGLGAPPDGRQVVALYRKAAAAGSPEAARRLGELYLRGNVVLQNVGKARKWLQAAADRGDVGAERDLGEIDAEGLGTAKDPIEAYAWLDIAASQGDRRAAQQRDRVLETLSAAALGKAEALAQNMLDQLAAGRPAAGGRPAVAKAAGPAAGEPG
jgi:TPR repeat protein